jgi:hypothetical protein
MLPACAAVCPNMCRVGLSTTLSTKRFTLEALPVRLRTVLWEKNTLLKTLVRSVGLQRFLRAYFFVGGYLNPYFFTFFKLSPAKNKTSLCWLSVQSGVGC